MIDLLISLLIGIFLGTLAGLIPGLHPNTFSIFLLSLYPLGFPPSNLFVIIISAYITNSFVSFIPAVLLGAPEEGESLSVLPGHYLLLKGRGYEAIYLATLGGAYLSLLSLFLLPFLLFLISKSYFYIKGAIPIILIGVLLYLLYSEKGRRVKAMLIVIFSSLLGFLILDLPLNQDYVLFACFAGLFGGSTLLFSIKNEISIPEQTFYIERFTKLKRGILSSLIFSLFSGMLPALTSSQSTLLAQKIFKVEGKREFLFLNGAITTGYAIFSLFALFCLGKARSGAGAAILSLPIDLGYSNFLLMCSAIFFSCAFSIPIVILLSRFFVSNIYRIKYSFLCKFVFIFLIFASAFFLGLIGVAIFLTSCSLGIICQYYRVKRTLLMAVLMVPTIFLFLGI